MLAWRPWGISCRAGCRA
ncbi:hypothetical protein E2C01_093314 [Portunus trituberculatus]|uniref:Uncharacterized protein n=1 Tax=Portunus trituberculatus TaxID=210409 RepID=A0A5B7JY85_PORTR|nr:hypothetical protein [Portunus trituberculatus]